MTVAARNSADVSEFFLLLKAFNVSTGQTIPPVVAPIVQPKSPINWLTLIVSVVAAVLAGPHVIPTPTPTPTPPVVIVDPPTPAPSPAPIPSPTPAPLPSPPTPIVPSPPIVSGVTVLDSHNKALGNSVNPGIGFQVSGGTGVLLTADPSNINDADIFQVADNKLVCTLRNECRLTIIVTNGGQKPAIFAIQCNRGPQPPPVPTPIPTPTPTVDPIPVPMPDQKVTGVRVLLLFDAKQNMSRDQINALASPTVIDLLNAKCIKDSSGRPDWHKWDKDTDTSHQPDSWRKLMSASLSEIAARSLKNPVLCIEAGSKLTLCEITNEASILNPLHAVFGG